jgi:hypothetical protein
MLCTTALAHDYWGNGQEVDRATRDLCCGKNDCKEIMPNAMHVGGDGLVRFDDVPLTVPATRIMPSPDGRIWRCIWGSQIKCLFAPLSGS